MIDHRVRKLAPFLQCIAAIATLASLAAGPVRAEWAHEIFKLRASDGGSFFGDTHGANIAVSGNIALVGAPRSKSAYVFDLTTGEQLLKLTSRDTLNSSFGWSVALSG